MGDVRSSPYANTAQAKRQRQAVYNDSLRGFFVRVFWRMMFGLLITAAVSAYLAYTPGMMASLFPLDAKGEPALSEWWLGAALVELGMVLYLSNPDRIRAIHPALGAGLFFGYAALNGLTLSPVIYAYDPTSTVKVFMLAAAVFGGSALAGATMKLDMTGFWSFFRMGLFAVIGMLVANIFFRSPAMDYAVSTLALAVFIGVTAFNMQVYEKIFRTEGSSSGLVTHAALSFYLDFVNIFLHLLRLIGVRTSR